MGDVTVGPVQTYVDDSISSFTSIDQNTTQESVSVNLTGSNLWLVDTSKLSGETIDPQTQYTLLNLETKYQTIVPVENVDFTVATLASPSLGGTDSSYLQTNLSLEDSLMLAQVTGTTQLGSDGVSLTSTSSSGSDSGMATGSSGSLSGSGGGTGSSSTGFSGAGSSDAGSSNTGSSDTESASDPSIADSQVITNPQATVNPQVTISPQPVEPVPFEISPAIGLLLVLLMFSYKILRMFIPTCSDTYDRHPKQTQPIHQEIN
ncbi:hypothetical protein ACN4EK_26155 [Pantanalinema rosaneae CENA516]|uniref:hypothetical protein n=1 Tax=Pantanalinema rosaneae TaxID=1620701 RepID=UPI003D6F1B93